MVCFFLSDWSEKIYLTQLVLVLKNEIQRTFHFFKKVLLRFWFSRGGLSFNFTTDCKKIENISIKAILKKFHPDSIFSKSVPEIFLMERCGGLLDSSNLKKRPSS